MFRLLRPLIPLLTLAACSGTTPPPPDAGTSCIPAANAELYCSVDSDCCSGGFCDPVTRFCRSSAQCGASLEWCSAAHPCCSTSTCQVNSTCSGGGPNP